MGIYHRRQKMCGGLLLLASTTFVTTGCGGSTGDVGSGESEDAGSTTTEIAGPSTTEPGGDGAADFSAPGIVVIAHRGASAQAPEHTFAAYDLAIEQGADYIEQDLQLTADGELVVLHDPTLDRTVRGPGDRCRGAVAERTVADLEACDAGSWFNEANPGLADPDFADEPVPTMAEVFDRYGADVRYYIEVKAPDEQPGMEDALLDLLDDAALATDDPDLPPVVIQSFSAASLERIHERRPDLPLVQLLSATGPPIDEALLDRIATYAVGIGPAKGLVDSELVAAADERCLAVHPYTVDDPVEMATLLDAGVSGMFTNVPEVLVDARADATPDDGRCPAPATAEVVEPGPDS